MFGCDDRDGRWGVDLSGLSRFGIVFWRLWAGRRGGAFGGMYLRNVVSSGPFSVLCFFLSFFLAFLLAVFLCYRYDIIYCNRICHACLIKTSSSTQPTHRQFTSSIPILNPNTKSKFNQFLDAYHRSTSTFLWLDFKKKSIAIHISLVL